MGVPWKFMLPGIAFLLTLAFGLWLSSRGRPYNSVLFNLHKLIALVTVVLLGIRAVDSIAKMSASVLIVVLPIVMAACALALFVSGALMSVGKAPYAPLLTIHRVASMLLVIAFPWMVYLVASGME